MKVVVVHNRYQRAGGEDRVVEAETTLLRSKGHEVHLYERHNDDVEELGHLALAAKTLWNPRTYRELRELCERTQPDILHVHNTLPLVSPAAYHAARSSNTPVVQTLHNYRLMCASAVLRRDGEICELCVGRPIPWPAVAYACYRDDRKASAAVASMLTIHRAIGTYRNQIDAYIALTEFAARKFIAGGLPAAKIHVKPNFHDATHEPLPPAERGDYALFIGRLEEEKGIRVLLEAWQRYDPPLRLVVLGEGPLGNVVEDAAAASDRIEALGWREHAEAQRILAASRVVVVPSLWYEGMPMTIVESMAAGVPVVASDLGSMESLTDDGVFGYNFPAGDAQALADRIGMVVADAERERRMQVAARAQFEDGFTPAANYARLIQIYDAAARARGRNLTPAP